MNNRHYVDDPILIAETANILQIVVKKVMEYSKNGTKSEY